MSVEEEKEMISGKTLDSSQKGCIFAV